MDLTHYFFKSKQLIHSQTKPSKYLLTYLTIRVGKLLKAKIHNHWVAAGFGHLPVTCIGLLVDLLHTDGISQQDLAIHTINDKGNVSTMVRSLEKEKLIMRKPDPKDKRSKKLWLTPAGHTIITSMMEAAGLEENFATKVVSEADLLCTKNTLKLIYQNLYQLYNI